ncbi:MAG TPA: YeeE/YedE thiosulfate transporter family protein [bacterium]|nr:YeeE/YedE thiosulfate transporter family protein [bacterium]HPN44471.1 YeeE/YedE thiosulfate transporter family protein [bacterium]
MAPFPLEIFFGKFGAYLVYLFIGMAFGAVLEMAGFAHSPKLAAQFYFKDMTVLKVMFTAIVVAMTLIVLASGLQLLDFSRLWVNPTYLWPGIIGGLIMGLGFIIGGFCPGTSLVALATLRIDGLFFSLGVLTGIFFFGETVDSFARYWNSSYLGRLTIPDWLGLGAGPVVVIIVLMALFMFWGGEQLEKKFGNLNPPAPKWKLPAAAVLLLAAILTVFIGQPSAMDKWNKIAPQKEAALLEREIQIHPGELLSLMNDETKNLVMLDMRPETDYNIFHLRDAKRITNEELSNLAIDLLNEPANTVIVLMSNDEEPATTAWKILTASSVPNIYILEGGINYWLDIFKNNEFTKSWDPQASRNEVLTHSFPAALGYRHIAADPDYDNLKDKLQYTPKVKLVTKVRRQGGCG